MWLCLSLCWHSLHPAIYFQQYSTITWLLFFFLQFPVTERGICNLLVAAKNLDPKAKAVCFRSRGVPRSTTYLCESSVAGSANRMLKSSYLELSQQETWRCDRPIDQQVLLHSEALWSRVALRFVLGPPWFGWGFAGLIFIALQLWELQHLFLFDAAEVPCLFPHSGRVNNQRVLETRVLFE